MRGSALKELGSMTSEAFRDWREDKAPRLAAALSFYTVLSLAPVIVILIAILGLFLSDSGAIIEQEAKKLLGERGAAAVVEVLRSASRPSSGVLATVVGVVMLLVGATGVFSQLRDALNRIWEVAPGEGRAVEHVLRGRLLSFALLLTIGFLLLISLVVSAAVTFVGDFFQDWLPVSGLTLEVGNFLLFLTLATVLFALIFKMLPEVQIAWRAVWVGAFVTSFLFTLGKLALELYLGVSNIGSAYGAAGSFVVLLLWVYYSAQILLFGAEFAQAYSKRVGEAILPAPGARAFAAPPVQLTAQRAAREASVPGAARCPPRFGLLGYGLGLAVFTVGVLLGSVGRGERR